MTSVPSVESRASSRRSRSVRLAAIIPHAVSSDGIEIAADRSIGVAVSASSLPSRTTVSFAGCPIGSVSSAWLTSGSSSAYLASIACGVDPGQQVAGFDAGGLGRRLVGDPRHERARARSVADPRLHFDPEPAALDAPVLDQRVDDRAREVARDRAAQAEADFVDADELAREIDERPARVARIDRGVVPDPAHDRAHILAVERIGRAERLRHDHLRVADDAFGDRLRQRERAAHREHRLARPQLRRVAELRGRKRARLVRMKLDDGDVRERIGADKIRRHFLLGRQRADDLARSACDVVIGDDVPVRGDDRAAARQLAFHFAAGLLIEVHDRQPHEAREHGRDRAIDGRAVTGRRGLRRRCRRGRWRTRWRLRARHIGSDDEQECQDGEQSRHSRSLSCERSINGELRLHALHAGAADPAVAVGILGEVLLVVILRVEERRRVLDFGRNRTEALRLQRGLVPIA